MSFLKNLGTDARRAGCSWATGTWPCSDCTSWSLRAGVGCVTRHSISLSLNFSVWFFYRALHLSSFQTDTAVGKNMSLLGCHWARQRRAVETELFLLLATSKDHTADDVGIFFFPLFSIICSHCRHLHAAFLLPKHAARPWSVCRPDLTLLRELLPCYGQG